MPYCRKCGAKLDEGTKYCHVCGTSVAVPSVIEYARRERRPLFAPAIILIALLVAAFVIAVFIFLPVRTIDIEESRYIPSQVGVDNIELVLAADVANVNVTFENLADKLVVLNVSANGGVGAFAPTSLLSIAFNYTVVHNTLTLTSNVNTVLGWPASSWLYITCDLRLDQSMSSAISVRTNTGKITLKTQSGTALNSLNLETTTGKIEAILKDSTVKGTVSFTTRSGDIKFSWTNMIAKNNIMVNAKTTTGPVIVNATQDDSLLSNVTMNIEATTGGIQFDMAIQNNIGARIESAVTLGAINVHKQDRFAGSKSPLQSSNYHASSNFDVHLKTTTGAIDIGAKYAPIGSPA